MVENILQKYDLTLKTLRTPIYGMHLITSRR